MNSVENCFFAEKVSVPKNPNAGPLFQAINFLKSEGETKNCRRNEWHSAEKLFGKLSEKSHSTEKTQRETLWSFLNICHHKKNLAWCVTNPRTPASQAPPSGLEIFVNQWAKKRDLFI